VNIEQLDDPLRTYSTFDYSGKITVAVEIIQSVNIKLAGNQLVKKFAGVRAIKNLDGQA
jgi:hypothetical protein